MNWNADILINTPNWNRRSNNFIEVEFQVCQAKLKIYGKNLVPNILKLNHSAHSKPVLKGGGVNGWLLS